MVPERLWRLRLAIWARTADMTPKQLLSIAPESVLSLDEQAEYAKLSAQLKIDLDAHIQRYHDGLIDPIQFITAFADEFK